MRKNVSPWIHQLDKEREVKKLREDLSTDVAIIGAGIAGVSTAFFVLKNTDKRVVMIEKFKLAHGATGHNAGHVIADFERDLSSIADEFGLEMAVAGQKALEDAWELLDQMYTDAGLDIPFARFEGHLGISTLTLLTTQLRDNECRKKGGLNIDSIYVAETAPFVNEIPTQYIGLYKLVPHKRILELLETEDPQYQAVMLRQSGTLNSALFCEEVISYLSEKYPERFFIYEHTPIDKLVLHKGSAILDAGTNTIAAERVVLCTNGFENIIVINETGLDIDAKYHHLVHGYVGYMSGYLEKMNKPPTANAFFGDKEYKFEDPYYYMTRRPYEYERGQEHNLISMGGPDRSIEEMVKYSYEEDYPDEMADEIDKFIKKTYDTDPNRKIEYIFTWHGLMGFTKNGIRLVGPEPQNPVLLYNLGCNGIGILPSIMGGERISHFINGERLEKSIFDVPARA